MIRRLLARIANEAAAGNSLVDSQIRSTDRDNPGARMAGKDASGHDARRESTRKQDDDERRAAICS